MRTKKSIVIAMISVTLVLTLYLVFSVDRAYAFAPPPAGFHYMGPASIGAITFEPRIINFIDVTHYSFSGRCGGEEYTHTGIFDRPFSEINEELLEAGYFIDFEDFDLFELPERCLPAVYPDTEPDGLMIINVKDFDDSDEDQKIADVVMMWVVPKGK